jgi:3-deoxy-D-manno-octulosonic-acid transferase
LLLDTLGELGACWGLADIAFVGGSLTQRGGQNMLEPAAFGTAVLFGPNTWNFRDIVEQLLSRNAARVVRAPEELTATVRELLRDPSVANELGASAQAFVASQQGAAAKTVDLLLRLPIDGANAMPNRQAA